MENTALNKSKEKPIPNYSEMNGWELWSKDLMIEYRQCIDEGKDIAQYEELFRVLADLPATDEKERMCDVLFDIITNAPIRSDYKYIEPNEIDKILELRKPFELKMQAGNIEDRMLGGWYGRICGCLLGKPIEGIRSCELEAVCKMIGNYPLNRYLEREDISNDICKVYPKMWSVYSKDMREMPADDDTNYMLIALELLKRHGRDFTSKNVADLWLDSQTINCYCTAEHIAYINFLKGYNPPDSARYKNAFREYIGAQIRADVFGYVNPCEPEAAAEMGWRDARISHIKNGIYGEMWVSAMIAAAYGSSDRLGIIRRGLAEVPSTSRLYEAVEAVCTGYENGVSEKECFGSIATRWDEYQGYDWCHTVANAEIVAASLLYGEGDYGKSICMAVSQGFDTDCNGATVGSVLGVVLGYEKLPREWTDRINDTLCTTLFGKSKVSVKECARQCMEFVKE